MDIIFSLVLLFVGVAVLVVIHVCVVGRAFRLSSSGEEGIKATALRSLPNLPRFVYKDERTLDCVVCLESFKDGDECCLLPGCNHSFHAQCIETWLLRSSFCPICRSLVVFQCNPRASSVDDVVDEQGRS